MSKSLAHPLALVCALVLALPSGWCCLPPLQTVRTTPSSVSAACCCCHETTDAAQPSCCCCGKSNTPDRPAQPTPLVKGCCCSTPLSTAPTSVAPSQPQATALLVCPGLDVSTTAGVTVEQRDDFSPLSCPLHLFQCVWRC